MERHFIAPKESGGGKEEEEEQGGDRETERVATKWG